MSFVRNRCYFYMMLWCWFLINGDHATLVWKPLLVQKRCAWEQPPRGAPWVSGLVGHFVQTLPNSDLLSHSAVLRLQRLELTLQSLSPVLALYDPFGVDVLLNCDTTTTTILVQKKLSQPNSRPLLRTHDGWLNPTPFLKGLTFSNTYWRYIVFHSTYNIVLRHEHSLCTMALAWLHKHTTQRRGVCVLWNVIHTVTCRY